MLIENVRTVIKRRNYTRSVSDIRDKIHNDPTTCGACYDRNRVINLFS
jgi:hypothetical protein